MCDFNGRLIAWLDQELPANESSEVEQHLQKCAECQARTDSYERASNAFNVYCDKLVAAQRQRPHRTPRWKTAVLGSGAVAAAVALLAILAQPPRQEIARPQASSASNASPLGLATPPEIPATRREAPSSKAISIGSIGRIRRRNVAPHLQEQEPNLLPAGPAVEITIPADEVLPPGAVPPGANFVVDISIAPDGLAQGLRLRPQLAGFERRTSHP